MSKKIIIAGGGTGGHIFPAIAIANALKKADPSIELLFIGAKGKMEMEKVPQAGYPIEGLDIAGFNRSSLIKNIGLPLKLLKSFLQVRRIVNSFRPDAVIGVGGYSSFPVLRYAQGQGIPTFIHESNSFAGKSNKLLGKKATRIFVATEGMEQFFPAGKLLITGNPVRESITRPLPSREEAIRFFGLDPALKTVLVTGGSLGAKGINEGIDAQVGLFAKKQVQLIWQTGKLFVEKATERAVENKNIWANSFITQMEYAYAAADVVVSRAGAMAIAELCVVQKPVVFVPFPFAAEDHQTVNAQGLVAKNAGMMVKDSEATQKLVPLVIELARDEAKQMTLKKNIAALGVRDADSRIAQEVLQTIK
ncbi:MAG: undecaprenyldiphospho-muramoylpentapeptide beta-N-acetylglucosaminyltransferase [Candidatus Pseudobacter hemicellulosilyticus]|uniref:UDP-N-acetylglucosamine--N-acetylmuramyl-(pentapeptide) pyrophosphoryl-undecaprenol N-acetylglucosamine transferase n=1 Tax=Candidatus Pseudobacter hemicellulosilyticus TaxID=3121375 RepID=A0AAJ6BHG8_9BACT|nr:MAG: undecaprenyldiphospho-muramoylpentapeptide beta-N-acetylglucosaminyltransferase [Pseudobacter sp.]